MEFSNTQIKARLTKAATQGLSRIAHGNNVNKSDKKQPSQFGLIHRPSSIWNFNDDNLFPLHNLLPTPNIPIALQESIVINELIHCLVGIRGTYIVPSEKCTEEFRLIKFTVSQQIQESLRDIVHDVNTNCSDSISKLIDNCFLFLDFAIGKLLLFATEICAGSKFIECWTNYSSPWGSNS